MLITVHNYHLCKMLIWTGTRPWSQEVILLNVHSAYHKAFVAKTVWNVHLSSIYISWWIKLTTSIVHAISSEWTPCDSQDSNTCGGSLQCGTASRVKPHLHYSHSHDTLMRSIANFTHTLYCLHSWTEHLVVSLKDDQRMRQGTSGFY
jgi:hypothetical protein